MLLCRRVYSKEAVEPRTTKKVTYYGHLTWIWRSPLVFECNRWPRGELESKPLSHYALTHGELRCCV